MYMDGFRAMMKLKRKELDDVNDDFSDFSLSSPATKIRRLDADLAPVMEDEEMAPPYVSPAQPFSGGMGQVINSGIIIEELPSEPANEERALVLFKPMKNSIVQSPSNFSVDPHLLSRIRNKILLGKSKEDDTASDNGNGNECLAVVPWAPSKPPSAPETEIAELMDADDMGVASMDIEEEYAFNSGPNPVGHLNQWQQQHCLIPQLPQNTSAPITWFQ